MASVVFPFPAFPRLRAWLDMTAARQHQPVPPPTRPVDPGPVFIGDAAMPFGSGTMWLENWQRARHARVTSQTGRSDLSR